MTATATQTKPKSAHPELKVADRCETASCAAQAFVLVEIPVASSEEPLDVRYCAHHYNKHSAGLAGAGATIVQDKRHMINSKPTDAKASNGF